MKTSSGILPFPEALTRCKRCLRGFVLAGALGLLVGTSPLANAQVRFSFGVAVPGVSIGINIPAYPDLVPIPGYPVYYAPNLDDNLFFYDGLYWVFVGDVWYYSSWYDGPWYAVSPEAVPDFILRIPVFYYRAPPPYFLRWNRAGPPRWGEHWGRRWEERRHGWDRWDRRVIPPRAPLPHYQRDYPRPRYPGPQAQHSLENRYYRFSPREERDRRRLEAPPGRAGRTPAPPPGAYRAPPAPMRAQPGAARPDTRPPAAPGPQRRVEQQRRIEAQPRVGQQRRVEQQRRKGGEQPPAKDKRDEHHPPRTP